MIWSDTNTPLRIIKERLIQFNQERDWGQYHNPRNLAMAVNVESAELLEPFLWCNDGGEKVLSHKRQAIEEEAADVLICLLNFCTQADIDLCAVVAKKIEKNARNYPIELAKGRSEKHTQLKE